MKLLRRTLFGNPILRQKAAQLSREEILSPSVQQLIADMRATLDKRQYGVGLAAPQIGKGIALCIVGIKSTPTRPDENAVNMVVINPEITKMYGRKASLWEGCISLGTGEDSPLAQTMRFKRVRVKYYDEHAILHESDFEGLLAHVLQHEVDHLNGILFTERIKDIKTLITRSEYKKRYHKRAPKIA